MHLEQDGCHQPLQHGSLPPVATTTPPTLIAATTPIPPMKITQQQAIEIARRAAVAARDEHGHPLHSYLPMDGGQNWMPHDWVIDAIMQAAHQEDQHLQCPQPNAPQGDSRADAGDWDGKLHMDLQIALNDVRLAAGPLLADELEHQVRESFRAVCTDLARLRRMYRAAQGRCDAFDAAQPDPFAAPHTEHIAAQRSVTDAMHKAATLAERQAAPAGGSWVDRNVAGSPALMQAMRNHADAAGQQETPRAEQPSSRPLCRDCADMGPICPNSGIACDGTGISGAASKARQQAECEKQEPAITVTIDEFDLVQDWSDSRLPPGTHKLYAAPLAKQQAELSWLPSGNVLVRCPACVQFDHDATCRECRVFVPRSAQAAQQAGLPINAIALLKEARQYVLAGLHISEHGSKTQGDIFKAAELLRSVDAALADSSAKAEQQAVPEANLNDWFLSLPEGRQAVLRQDKWSLAHAAFEAGRLAAAPQAEQRAEREPITWPKARDVGRLHDMSPAGHLRVGLDGDNDVFVEVFNDQQEVVASVEFCNPGAAGGGRSSRTRKALISLMAAMESDNAECPDLDWWARRGGIGKEGAP